MRCTPGPDVYSLPQVLMTFFSVSVSACDYHILSEQGLPLAIRWYKWSRLNQAVFVAVALMIEENILPSCIY